jgi:uncharacterized metal-binding protein YceD (DUF177 family)
MSGRGDKVGEPAAWRYRVALDAIPADGLVQEFEADAAERQAMRELAEVRDVSAARARFELHPVGRGRVRASGRITATVGQTCVVSLDPMETVVDEPVEALFVPVDEVEAVTKALDKEAEVTGELADPPEPIVNGMIDLGKLAADALFLAIDPYPRKPDAAFQPPEIAEDPEDHPFAALKALKGKPPPEPGET